MCNPGYYKSNYRALTLRELARMQGLVRLPLTYLITRFKSPTPAGWMPHMWADLECAEHELSPDFFRAVARYRGTIRNLGFSDVGFKKLKHILNPNHRDDGGINFLDGSHSHFGQLIYNKSHVPPPIDRDREQVIVAFTAVFETGTLIFTNNTRTAFDSPPQHTVVRIASDDVARIYRHFVDAVQTYHEPPRRFRDQQALRAWFDSNAVEIFTSRVRRGLFVPMSDEEVAEARR
jgi:hypothetical protein